MPRPRACERRRAVVLEVPGGEEHERHRHDLLGLVCDRPVDRLVDDRLGHLDEPELDRQLARVVAHGFGEPPELLDPVGVPAPVADDDEHPLLGHRRGMCLFHDVHQDVARARTVAVAATSGTTSVTAHSSGCARSERTVSGMLPL